MVSEMSQRHLRVISIYNLLVRSFQISCLKITTAAILQIIIL
jgi:hypothetical protein